MRGGEVRGEELRGTREELRGGEKRRGDER